MPLALFPLMPLRCEAVCSCPNGFDSCVCTEDDPATKKKEVRRADAAGRDRVDEKQFREEFLGQTAGGAPVQPKQQPKGKQSKEAAAPSGPPAEQLQIRDTGPLRLERGALTGGGSQEKGDMTKADARARFADIVMQTVAKREAEYGFQLDSDDVRQIADVLRVKYCGPEGLIGPC